MAQWNEELLEQFYGSELSKLTTCGAPGVCSPPNFLGTLFLNDVFILQYKMRVKRAAATLIRQMTIAVDEYQQARTALQSSVAAPRGSSVFVKYYLNALRHYESCILSSHHAICAYLSIKSIMLHNLVITNSHFELVRKLANRVKHFDEDILNDDPPPSPLWITNSGLQSRNATLSFCGLVDALDDLQEASHFLAETLPREWARQLSADGCV